MSDTPHPTALTLILAKRAARRRLARLDADFRPLHTERSRNVLKKLLGDVEPRSPPTVDLDAIWAKADDEWRRRRSLKALSRRELRQLPWVLFGFPHGSTSKRWLASDPEIVGLFGQRLRESFRVRDLRVLLRAFVLHYPLGSATFDAWRELLVESLAASDSLLLDIWRARRDVGRVLSSGGSEEIARRWIETAATASDFLEQAQLAGDLEWSAFMRHALRDLLGEIRARLARRQMTPAQLAAALTFLMDQNGKLRFDDERRHIPEAFLLSFAKNSPDGALAAALTSFLVRHFGHPRLQKSRWIGVDEQASAIMVRWLLRGTFDRFFALLDATALDRHWQARKAFWSAYLNREAITDAWMVLGSEARAAVVRHFAEDDLESRYAELRAGRGIQANHSVLLMRIGDLIIAEWSHVGPCRIWADTDPNAPRLYERTYTGEQLRTSPDLAFPHIGDWQFRVSYEIQQETGIELTARDYLVPPARKRR